MYVGQDWNYIKMKLRESCAYLTSKKMPDDFHKHLVVLVRRLVSRDDDLSAGEILQLVHLHRATTK